MTNADLTHAAGILDAALDRIARLVAAAEHCEVDDNAAADQAEAIAVSMIARAAFRRRGTRGVRALHGLLEIQEMAS